jgi:Family of unknown function (DUF6056)
MTVAQDRPGIGPLRHWISVRVHRILPAAVALAIIGVSALLLALALFAYPSADDFCLAVKLKDLGFAGAQAWWYHNWMGRYVSTAAISAFIAGGDLVEIYRFAAIAVLLLTFASFALLVWSLGRDRYPLRVVLLAAGVVTVLFAALTPDPAQTFYWMTGSFTYQLGNVFVVLLAALLVWRETRPTAKNHFVAPAFIASAIAAVAAVGSNEVSLLVTVLVLSAGTFVAFSTRRDSRYYWAALAAIALAAALISVLAPGNGLRAASMQGDGQIRPDPWLAALAYLPWTALRVLYWFSNVGVWASALILLWATAPASRQLLYSNGRFDKRFLAVPIAWVVLLFLLNAVGFLVNRYPLPERAEGVVALVFLLGWYPSFVVLAHYGFGDRIVPATEGRMRLAGVLLLVSLLGSPTIFEAYKDVYRGYRYDKEMQARFAMLRSVQGNSALDVTVGGISRPPRTLFATDFVTDPRNFRNSCASEYFGVRSITLGAPAK